MTTHTHDAPAFPAINPGPDEVSLDLYARLVGAARDGCQPCQDTLTVEALDGDPRVITHAALMAWTLEDNAITALVGTVRPVEALPDSIQPLVRAVQANPDHIPAWEAAGADLTLEERREALDYALDTLIGVLSTQIVS